MYDFKEYILDVNQLQVRYQKLLKSRRITRKAICDLCIPFRDKYGLTDCQTLLIARRQVDLDYILNDTEIEFE